MVTTRGVLKKHTGMKIDTLHMSGVSTYRNLKKVCLTHILHFGFSGNSAHRTSSDWEVPIR